MLSKELMSLLNKKTIPTLDEAEKVKNLVLGLASTGTEALNTVDTNAASIIGDLLVLVAQDAGPALTTGMGVLVGVGIGLELAKEKQNEPTG